VGWNHSREKKKIAWDTFPRPFRTCKTSYSRGDVGEGKGKGVEEGEGRAEKQRDGRHEKPEGKQHEVGLPI